MRGIGPAAKVAGATTGADTGTNAATGSQPAGAAVPATTKFRGVLAALLAPLREQPGSEALPSSPPKADGRGAAGTARSGASSPAQEAAPPATAAATPAKTGEPRPVRPSQPARHTPKPAAAPAIAALPLPPLPPIPVSLPPITPVPQRLAQVAASSPAAKESRNAVPSVAASGPTPVPPAARAVAQAGLATTAPAPLHAAAHGQVAPMPAQSVAGVAAPDIAATLAASPVPTPTAPLQAPGSQSASSTAPTAGHAAAAKASPAAQLAPVLMRIAADPAGAPQLTLRLAPVELGAVQVQLVRAHDGSAQVAVTAERPETLQLLQREAPSLHQALDAAGLSQASRSITFELAPAAVPTNSGSFGASAGDTPRQRRGQPRAPRPSAPSVSPLAAIGGWSRAGIDVTA
jgi:flagellar hook-length control protein FliK